jgi:hypothetical protein
MPSDFLVVKPKTSLVKIKLDVEDGQIEMGTRELLERDEKSSSEISGDAFSKFKEVNVGIGFLKDAVVSVGGSPEVKIRSIFSQEQVASFLQQEALGKADTPKVFLCVDVNDSAQSALKDIECGSKLESDAVLEVYRSSVSEGIEALKQHFYLMLLDCHSTCSHLAKYMVLQELLCKIAIIP